MITELHQGGSCADHGVVGYAMLDPATEPLKAASSAKGLFYLFTPSYFKYIGVPLNKLSTNWLWALDPKDLKVEICHQNEEAPVEYTRGEWKMCDRQNPGRSLKLTVIGLSNFLNFLKEYFIIFLIFLPVIS